MVSFSYQNRKRWNKFKKNRRGYYSFIIFTILFTISLFAELIMNEKPLIVIYNNQWYFPIFKDYLETDFNGEFASLVDYQDPYIKDHIQKNGRIIFTLFPYSYDSIVKDLQVPSPSPPSFKNWLGTDENGRDVLVRIIYGFRLSVFFSIFLTIISMTIGIIAGAIQGYFGSWIDLILQRIIEIWDSIPMLYLLIILSSIIEISFLSLLIFMSIFSWLGYVSVIRAEFFRARQMTYVKAAKAIGISEIKIIIKHVLPNCLVATIAFFPFNLSGAITALSSLDFLGVGLPAPTPSLGELIYQGMKNLQSPWLGLSGFFSLSILLLLLVFIGEAIRDALDFRN